MTRVLVVEDEESFSDALSFMLRKEGFEVGVAATGTDAVAQFDQQGADVVLLDLMLPGMSGTEVCRNLRQRSNVPIIMVTAKDGEVDKVVGLELGADDYVTKPFSPRELVARVKAILRRADGPRPADTAAVLAFGAVEVDVRRREARLDGTAVPLAAREFELLQYLAENRGIALSRRQLLDGVWGDDWIGDERTVDVHVRQLRKKFGDHLPLTTVWGVGYRLD